MTDCQYIECILPRGHVTPHLSEIIFVCELGFKWRIYWTESDWGHYICDEAGQYFDFEKFNFQ